MIACTHIVLTNIYCTFVFHARYSSKHLTCLIISIVQMRKLRYMQYKWAIHDCRVSKWKSWPGS